MSRDVEEHPGGQDAVERGRRRREALDVSDLERRRRGPARARPCADETSTMTTSQSSSPEIRAASSPGPPPTSSTRSGAHLGDRIERDLTRIRAFRVRVEGAASLEIRLGRVLSRDGGRVVDPHRSTIGRPGAPLPGCFAPSQAQTVAPTSPNSPSSWMRPGGVLPRRVREEQRVLARVVGRRGRRVAAVIGGEDQQIAVAQRLEDVVQPAVEVLQAAVEVDRVVAVAPELVGLDEVREDEAVLDVLEQLDRAVDPVDVRLRRERLVDVAAGEDVGDLPDAVDRVPGGPNRREVVRAARLEREVVPVRRPLVVARLADERAAR